MCASLRAGKLSSAKRARTRCTDARIIAQGAPTSCMCPIKTINLPCVLLLFCKRILLGSIGRQAARSGFCWAGYQSHPHVLVFVGSGYQNSSEIVRNSGSVRSPFGNCRIVIPRPHKNQSARMTLVPVYPAQQKPDRAACRSIEPGRNRSQNKSKTQGKFIVFIGHMRDVGAPCVIARFDRCAAFKSG